MIIVVNNVQTKMDDVDTYLLNLIFHSSSQQLIRHCVSFADLSWHGSSSLYFEHFDKIYQSSLFGPTSVNRY